jgi:glycosyltransferase involved in cell wall biosynthesis
VKIRLFECFADPYRESMLVYGRALRTALKREAGSAGEILNYEPFAFLNPRAMRYVSQYLLYPAAALFHQGTVNHILDHSYAHLVHTLDASKTVVTFHDAIWLKVRKGNFEDAKKSSLRGVQAFNLAGLKKAARIVCDSSASRSALLEYLDYPAAKIEVVPLGLHEDFQSAKNIQKYPGLPEAQYILHVGHTQSYKNIPALFQVLAILKGWGKPVKLLKIGTDFSAEQSRLAQELQVSDLIVHLGKVKQELLPSVYRSAQVLLQPSLDEGFGFPVLEAMSLGTPVICSNRGSLPELAGDAAVLTNPDDYLAMAKSICGILENRELRADLIQRGLKRASLYTWQNTARRMMEIYRQVAEERVR